MTLSEQPRDAAAGHDAAPADAASNALLRFEDLPRFDLFDPSQVAPAIGTLIAQAREAVARAEDPATPATWEAFVAPLEAATERLGRAWGVVGHLNAVADAPALRDAYNANLPVITQFWTELGQNRTLFDKYRRLSESEGFAAMDAARRRVVDNALRNFRLGGAELESPARERFAALQERMAQLSQQFSENVLDATNAWSLVIDDESRLAGLPEDARQAARAEAEADGKPGWKFTLRFPSYLPVMQYAEDRALRETVYRAYVTRASELAPDAASPVEGESAARDNGPLIAELLSLRAEEATLLGFPSFADVSLAAKMAKSPQEVIDFLRDLARRARPSAERDLAELREFAAKELGLSDLQPWDLSWASEKLKEARYAFSDQTVKQYFQAPRVLDGLFHLIERLFSVAIRPDTAPVWHPDVQFFRIERDGALVGQFYVDLFARATKRSGAWMDDARGRRRLQAGVQTPVAYLNCNFQPPVGGRPGLLRHDDVITLFHEFGHGLHHLLTRVDELGVSGINGVEWDAVELPSQFMENWCWEWDVVSTLSAHVDTGEPLPRELFDRMVAAKNFQAGLGLLRQVEFALFDMRLHAEAQAGRAPDARELLGEVRREVSVLQPPAWNRFQNSFSHIFAGGYAAGYYSYLWAEVLSADCFAAFEEAGVFDTDTGRRFLDEILSVGGSRPALESFKAFRGREPRIDALLRHSGMLVDAEPAAA